MATWNAASDHQRASAVEVVPAGRRHEQDDRGEDVHDLEADEELDPQHRRPALVPLAGRSAGTSRPAFARPSRSRPQWTQSVASSGSSPRQSRALLQPGRRGRCTADFVVVLVLRALQQRRPSGVVVGSNSGAGRGGRPAAWPGGLRHRLRLRRRRAYGLGRTGRVGVVLIGSGWLGARTGAVGPPDARAGAARRARGSGRGRAARAAPRRSTRTRGSGSSPARSPAGTSTLPPQFWHGDALAHGAQFVMPLVIPMNTSSRSISSSLSIFSRKPVLDQPLGDEAAVLARRP